MVRAVVGAAIAAGRARAVIRASGTATVIGAPVTTALTGTAAVVTAPAPAAALTLATFATAVTRTIAAATPALPMTMAAG